ncbi:hypothetical protein AAG570_003674 [Ranatra chinensis]|uniref:Tudor domain-containing protein n=1 Tax=Ranatra chinensis TaxID=642074 RepID=A0ABD0Y6K7_9HEMI
MGFEVGMEGSKLGSGDFRLLQVAASARENRNGEKRRSEATNAPSSLPVIHTGKLTTVQEGPEPYHPGSYTARLVAFLEREGCPKPTYILLPRKPKGSPNQYSCRINVIGPDINAPGKTKEYDISSFPLEFANSKDAKEKVSEIAFLAICQKTATDKKVTSDVSLLTRRVIENCTTSLQLSSGGPDGVVVRVSDYHANGPGFDSLRGKSWLNARCNEHLLVGGRKSGVWAYHIEEDYETRFGEKLPSNWLQLLTNCSELMIENVRDFSAIVRPTCDADAVISWSPVTGCVTIPRPVQPPDSPTWDVYITRAISSTNVWLRFIGDEYSDKLDALFEELEDFYKHNSDVCRPASLEVDRCYAHTSDDGCTSRAVVIALPSVSPMPLADVGSDNSTVKVKFIDHGDIDYVPVKSLFILDTRFSRLPAQALSCCLDGLESYAENVVFDRLLAEATEGKSLVAELVMGPIHSSEAAPQLILYDTSGDAPVNINDYLAQIMELVSCRPTLTDTKVIHEAHLTHISADGYVYLQVPSKCLDYIKESLNEVNDELLERHRLTEPSGVQPHRLYLLRLSPGGTSYRVKVVGPVSAELGEVDIEMIDFGRTLTVPYTDLHTLEDVAISLNFIAPQCIQAQLKDIPSRAFAFREVLTAFQELIPSNRKVLLKMESAITENNNNMTVPVVELFRRIQPDNLIISINCTLRMNNSRFFTEPESNGFHNQDRAEMKSSLELVHTAPINKKFFNVHVVSAANPFNFIVQPEGYKEKYSMLLSSMEKFYSIEQLGRPVTEAKPGLYCAAYLKKEGCWLRGCVEQMISVREVCFYACDTGELHVIQSQDLFVLEQSFMKLPALALNARLAGITPLHGDWLVEDTRRFQQLVEGKSLASVILSHSGIVRKSGGLAPRVTLTLKLFDKNKQDMDIGHIFVLEHRGRYV